jgi:hypothetical protein
MPSTRTAESKNEKERGRLGLDGAPARAEGDPGSTGGDGREQVRDPRTRAAVEEQRRFERTMDERGLLQEDGTTQLPSHLVRHEEPPGSEQSAG